MQFELKKAFGSTVKVNWWKYLVERWRNRHVKKNTEFAKRFMEGMSMGTMRRFLVRLRPTELQMPHAEFVDKVTRLDRL